MTYFYTWLQSNILEWIIYLPALHFLSKTQKNSANWLFITLCNAITHPIVFFGFMASLLTLKSSILFAEAFAVLGESLLIFYFYPLRINFWKILGIALLANLVSWQLAPYCTYMIIQLIY